MESIRISALIPSEAQVEKDVLKMWRVLQWKKLGLKVRHCLTVFLDISQSDRNTIFTFTLKSTWSGQNGEFIYSIECTFLFYSWRLILNSNWLVEGQHKLLVNIIVKIMALGNKLLNSLGFNSTKWIVDHDSLNRLVHIGIGLAQVQRDPLQI